VRTASPETAEKSAGFASDAGAAAEVPAGCAGAFCEAGAAEPDGLAGFSGLGGTGVTDFAVFCGVRAATGVALFATAGASGTEADGSAEPDGSSLARARTGCAAACGVRMAKFVSGVSLAWSAIFPLGAGSSAGCGGTLLHSGTVWTDFACEL
jgi:hypothetical protein